MIRLLRETGARPGELVRLTAADVHLGTGTATLDAHKTSRKTGKPRTLYFPPSAMRIVQRLMRERPEGRLLRNSYGNPW